MKLLTIVIIVAILSLPFTRNAGMPKDFNCFLAKTDSINKESRIDLMLKNKRHEEQKTTLFNDISYLRSGSILNTNKVKVIRIKCPKTKTVYIHVQKFYKVSIYSSRGFHVDTTKIKKPIY